jgi:hypothetical protein
MPRKSRAMSIMQADFNSEQTNGFDPSLTEHTLTDEMQNVVAEIDQIFGDVQVASLTAFWRVGKLLTDVKNNPDVYLTPEQRASHIDGASLIISIFAPIYTADQLRSAVQFYERYPGEQEITRLLSLRCPDRPRWRMTVSHVQLLSQVPDDEQRTVLEDKCAEEAYTARTLAQELQEVRGKQRNSGRTHQAPKGLKQQLLDVLTYQRRFIGRSEALWLAEDKESVYDELANAAPEKLDTTIRSFFAEMHENFDRMGELISDHMAMCRKLESEVLNAEEEESGEDSDESQAPKKRSNITR